MLITNVLKLWVAKMSAYPLAPIAVMLADDKGVLSSTFKYLEVIDNPGFDGMLVEESCKDWPSKYGKKGALVLWLWRNKAYTYSASLRAKYPDFRTIKKSVKGTEDPPKWGFWYYKETIESSSGIIYEGRYGFSFGKFQLYLKTGWKIKGIIKDPNWYRTKEEWNKGYEGLFTGIVLRSDRL